MQVLSITNWVLATRLITLRLGRHQIRSASVVEATRLCKGAGYGVAVVKSVRFQFPRDLLRHGLTKIRPWRMLAFHKSRVMQCRSIVWKDSGLSRRNEEMHEHTTFIIESIVQSWANALLSLPPMKQGSFGCFSFGQNITPSLGLGMANHLSWQDPAIFSLKKRQGSQQV